MNATKTILDWKNVVWLSLVSYALYTTLWLVIDDEIWHAPGQFSVTEMAVDFCMCVLFVGFSLLYSRTILRILPMRNRPYVRLLLMVCILFLLNNAMAYAMTVLCDAIWGDGSDELFRMQGIYTYGMVATFVSCIYSNAFYLETYMHTENEKRRLEIALLKEQEVALQSQLDALKSQIDTHFMFNNFSILAELIEMRYGKAVVVHIENDVRIADGSIPPACLQLLVENAIKHNRHSAEEPLHIDIRREGNHISVCNPVAPLFSAAEPSTGIGQKNIAERYALLSDRQMIVSFTRDTYAVKLPILEN